MSGKKQAAKPAGGLWGKTPASQQRRQEIILASKAVFLEEGYQLASMDRVAAVAGTTKRTLYDHFGNKEALFVACIEHGCRNFVGKLLRAEELPSDTAKGVGSFIERMASLLIAPDTVRFQRLVIAEADRHPEFAKILHENAFAGAERALEAYLVRQIEGGKLKPHDTAAWAHALVGLATNLELVQALLGVPSGRDSHGDRARKQLVVMYVRAHALDGSG